MREIAKKIKLNLSFATTARFCPNGSPSNWITPASVFAGFQTSMMRHWPLGAGALQLIRRQHVVWVGSRIHRRSRLKGFSKRAWPNRITSLGLTRRINQTLRIIPEGHNEDVDCTNDLSEFKSLVADQLETIAKRPEGDVGWFAFHCYLRGVLMSNNFWKKSRVGGWRAEEMMGRWYLWVE